MQKGFAQILVVVLLLIGLASLGAYYFGIQKVKPAPAILPSPTPTINPTANWETYTNTQYEFSYKYPPDAEIKEIRTQAEGVGKALFIINTREAGPGNRPNTEFYDGYTFTVLVEEKLVTETMDEISERHILGCKEVGKITKSSAKIIVNGIGGITYSCQGLGITTHVLLPVPKTNRYYFEILVSSDGPNKINYQKTLDQILSTFKFTQ